MTVRRLEVSSGGRVLEVWDAGGEQGPAVVVHHGTPSCGELRVPEVHAWLASHF